MSLTDAVFAARRKILQRRASVHKPERRLVACATPMTKGICAGFAAQFEIHAAFFHRLSTNGIDYEIQRVAAPQT